MYLTLALFVLSAAGQTPLRLGTTSSPLHFLRSQWLPAFRAEVVADRIAFAADGTLIEEIATACAVAHLGLIQVLAIKASVEGRLMNVSRQW